MNSPTDLEALRRAGLKSDDKRVEACTGCNETAIRDEKLIDALQQARYILSHSDLIRDPEARVERAKLAIEEAMRLMKPLRL